MYTWYVFFIISILSPVLQLRSCTVSIFYFDYFQFVIIRSRKNLFVFIALMKYKCSPPPPGQSAVTRFFQSLIYLLFTKALRKIY